MRDTLGTIDRRAGLRVESEPIVRESLADRSIRADLAVEHIKGQDHQGWGLIDVAIVNTIREAFVSRTRKYIGMAAMVKEKKKSKSEVARSTHHPDLFIPAVFEEFGFAPQASLDLLKMLASRTIEQYKLCDPALSRENQMALMSVVLHNIHRTVSATLMKGCALGFEYTLRNLNAKSSFDGGRDPLISRGQVSRFCGVYSRRLRRLTYM